MPITLIDIIKPKNNQPFPMVEDIDLLGGFRVVATDANRDAIGPKLKKHGMLCLVSSTKVVWSWNATSGIWELAFDLTTIGGQTQTPVQPIFIAECPSTSIMGDFVIQMQGTSTPSVTFADVNDVNKMPAMGVIIEKPDPITCKVQTSGMVTGVYSGLNPGRKYFVGTNHRPVTTPPVPNANGTLFIQPVGVALDPATLVLQPSVNLTKIRG